MAFSRLALVLALGLTAALGRADLILQAPRAPLPAGAEIVLTLLITNPSTEPALVATPAVVSLVARAGTRSVSAIFQSDTHHSDATIPLPPGGFRRVALRGTLPADFTGLVLLAPTDIDAGRVAVEIAAPPAAALDGVPPPAASTSVAGPTAPPRRDFGISPHDPIYFSVGANGGLNARFQLSFKFRPIGPSDDRIAGRGFWEDVYLGYTQTSLWDLQSLSKPFTDSSYKPALFFHRYDTGWTILGGRLGFSGGAEHESNGKAAPDSRSLNLLFARPTLRWGSPDSWQFIVSPKLYWYIDKSENADITRFRGYGDFLFALEHPRDWKLTATLRAGTSGKGSMLLDASYPFSRINDVLPLGLVHGYLHLQYFTGWGESLLHYNERADTQFRLGFMAIR